MYFLTHISSVVKANEISKFKCPCQVAEIKKEII
jgi:hypothetical protein